jgi:hypothetical protein
MWVFIMRIENSISSKYCLKNRVLRRFFEEVIDEMQCEVVDLLVLSVGHVKDDPCSCSVLQIVKLETSIRNANRRQLTFGFSSTA